MARQRRGKRREDVDLEPPRSHSETHGPGGEGEPADAAAAKLERAVSLLRRSPTGAALLEMAAEEKLRLIPDQQPNTYGYYKPKERVVAVNAGQAEDRMVATLAHELRHAWQDRRGRWFRLALRPHDQLHLMRALEADAEAVAVQTLHELDRIGVRGPLALHQAGEYGDISRAYAYQLGADRPIQPDDEREALRAAYDQWFGQPWRRRDYDKKVAASMEESLFAWSQVATEGRFRTLSAQWLRHLGELPDGRNYLDGTGARPLDHPSYGGGIVEEVERRLAWLDCALAGEGGESPELCAVPAPRRAGQGPARRALAPPPTPIRGRRPS